MDILSLRASEGMEAPNSLTPPPQSGVSSPPPTLLRLWKQ